MDPEHLYRSPHSAASTGWVAFADALLCGLILMLLLALGARASSAKKGSDRDRLLKEIEKLEDLKTSLTAQLNALLEKVAKLTEKLKESNRQLAGTQKRLVDE